jgi:hypothetical protein
MAVQTPPELQAHGWMTVDLWCAPVVTGLYAFLTHAQPFWVDLHRLMVELIGGTAAGMAVEPTDPEIARVICTMVLAGLFSSRTVVNFNMWNRPAEKRKSPSSSVAGWHWTNGTLRAAAKAKTQ